MLVVDASLVLEGSGRADGLAGLGDELVAPPLMWSEARSALRQLLWRGAIQRSDAEAMHARVEASPVRKVDHEQLGAVAWAIAEELGWAKTYDAEYVALARLLGCRLVTVDARLRHGADRLGLVVGPTEL